MFRLIPPAGTPISFHDMLHIIRSRLGTDSGRGNLEEKIRNQVGVKHCYLFNSGRTALLFILNALSKLAKPLRDEVVIPAYTCFTVAAAVARSGLKIRLVDIDPLTMDYNYEKLSSLDFTRVLAVIATNLFGILSNWKELRLMKQQNNVFLIDDAAQSMGVRLQNRFSGSFGDVGLYSLSRGKSLSTYSGGILVTNNEEIAANIEEDINDLKKPGAGRELKTLIEIALYSWLLRPKYYWLPGMLPFLGLGETIYDETFSVGHLTESQRCAGSVLFSNIKWLNTTRAENAARLAWGILKSGMYEIPGYNDTYCPSYLRLPLLAQDKISRDEAIRALRRRNVVASSMYPSTIRQIPGIERYLASSEDDFPGAQRVVERLFTLPTHPFLTEKDLQTIVSCLTSAK